MLLDDPLAVLFGGGSAEDAGLHVIAHLELVEVQVFAVIQRQRNLLAELLERGGGLGVNALVMQVDAVFEVDFRAGHVQERIGIALRQLCGFTGTDHIIGNGGDLCGAFDGGQQPVEGKKLSHDEFSCYGSYLK